MGHQSLKVRLCVWTLLFFASTLQQDPIHLGHFFYDKKHKCTFSFLKIWRQSAALTAQNLCATCNMVTACFSPSFVQIGAIPNFTTTNPTRRLPGKRTEENMVNLAGNRNKNHEEHGSHEWLQLPSVHSCRAHGSSLSGLSFSAVCLLYSSAALFLIYSWLSSVRCSSNHVVVFAVLMQPTNRAGLKETTHQLYIWDNDLNVWPMGGKKKWNLLFMKCRH